MDFYPILKQTSKMDTCDSCDQRIQHERDKSRDEPLGLLVCAECYDRLMSSPEETYPTIDMSDLVDALSGI